MRIPVEILAGGPVLRIGGSRVVLTPRLGLRVAEELIRHSTRDLVDQVASKREAEARMRKRGARR
jgi:hypothetical protein